MAKISIKSEKNHSFRRNISREGAFFPFCGSGYRQSAGSEVHIVRLSKREIVGSLSSVYFCGGDCVEDVTSHLMPHLSLFVRRQLFIPVRQALACR